AAEVAALRAQLGIGRDTRARASAWRNPPRDAERAERAERSDRKQVDFEGLLGRYGMLIIAALAAAGAVGTFLSWAIGHGYLTFSPAARVVVGLLVAACIGAWGLSLRRRVGAGIPPRSAARRVRGCRGDLVGARAVRAARAGRAALVHRRRRRGARAVRDERRYGECVRSARVWRHRDAAGGARDQSTHVACGLATLLRRHGALRSHRR